ncbi:4-hydroxytryptamine kinase [Frankliniella fusca]|uniref:4-hydroxytryptamine kinase n=1 Tax=Frankliniella fusca TaxID=407009 RepID=A0AAE1HSD8_9NEOP|nr:4-hydroxytryptamine kinase [Frankliniella fusca]
MSPTPPAEAASAAAQDAADKQAAAAPAWLQPAFMSAVVGAPVRKVHADALGAGDNFASVMVRVRVTTDRREDKHLIIKRLPTSAVEAFFPIARAFDQEGRVYADILPRMQGRLEAAGRGDPPLAPTMLHRTPADHPAPMLVFEDISVEGFRLATREQGLDEAHTRLVLRALARWHAAGALVLDAHPDLFTDTMRMVCKEHARLIDGMMVKGFARFLQQAERWPDEVARRAVAKLRLLQPDCAERLVAAHRPDPLDGAAFNTCLHGDLWMGNALFKYAADGKPVDVRFVDFQITTWGSPACDLSYFLCSVRGEVRARFDAMLAEYHTELEDCLAAMGARRVPSLDELKADMRRRGMAQVMHVAAGMPLVLAPHSLGLTFDNLVDVHLGDGPHPRDVALGRAQVRDTALHFFTAWEREGLLDALLDQ